MPGENFRNDFPLGLKGAENYDSLQIQPKILPPVQWVPNEYVYFFIPSYVTSDVLIYIE